MKNIPDELQRQYTEALRDYLTNPREEALLRAYEVGRAILTGGGGLIGISALHHRVLVQLLPTMETEVEENILIARAEEVHIESLMPFEMSLRAFRDAINKLRQFNERIESEAKRIAHALHQEAGGLLASTNLALEDLARDLSPSGTERLSQVRQLLDQMDSQLRQLSHEIRPTILDDLGLLPALKFLGDGVSKRSGVMITVEGSTDGRLPSPVETALYRNVQEALNNVVRHAQASQVTIQADREPSAIRLSVQDNGVGFDPASLAAKDGDQGLGHVGMRERLEFLHGTLLIKSSAGEGTELLMYIPLEI